MTTTEEIKEALEKEATSLVASSRKVDSLTIFNGILLIAIIEELQKANDTLEKILEEVD